MFTSSPSINRSPGLATTETWIKQFFLYTRESSPILGYFLGTPTSLDGGQQQDDTTLAGFESVNLKKKGTGNLPIVSSNCLD
jgi:hypothetical protein